MKSLIPTLHIPSHLYSFVPFFVALLAILIVFWTRLAKLHQRTTHWVKPQLKFFKVSFFDLPVLCFFYCFLFYCCFVYCFGIMLPSFALHPLLQICIKFLRVCSGAPVVTCLHPVWMPIVLKNNEHDGCEQNSHARAWLMPTSGTGSLGHCRLHAKSLPTLQGGL